MPTISFDNPIKTPRYVLGPKHTWDSPGTYSVLFDILREEYGEDHISYPQPCKHPRFYYPRHVKYEIGGNDELKNNRVFRSNPVHRATWAALNSANGKLERGRSCHDVSELCPDLWRRAHRARDKTP